MKVAVAVASEFPSVAVSVFDPVGAAPGTANVQANAPSRRRGDRACGGRAGAAGTVGVDRDRTELDRDGPAVREPGARRHELRVDRPTQDR